MSNNDSPAGAAGGPVTVSRLEELPERMRVHALAKVLGRTSREVLAVLTDLGVEVRSAQSSIDRKSAERVVTALVPESPESAESPESPGSAVGPAAPVDVAPSAPDAVEEEAAAEA